MTTIHISVKDDDGESHEYEEEAPLENMQDPEGLAVIIAYGLLYESDWIPGSMHDPVITVDGKTVLRDDYSSDGKI